jgi:hypothetical protein
MSAKSKPGDGSYGKGVKGQLADNDRRSTREVLRGLVHGLLRLRRR